MALRKDKELDYLEATLRYIGSFYVEQAPKAALGLEAEHLVYHADCPKDGFRVQALLILAIGLDGYTFQERALQILCDAQDLALELGMNTADFAVMNGGGLGVLEESWRRTWWELYIIDGMIAGVHQKSSFRLNNIPADVVLPCEEKEYISGVSQLLIKWKTTHIDLCSTFRSLSPFKTLTMNRLTGKTSFSRPLHTELQRFEIWAGFFYRDK